MARDLAAELSAGMREVKATTEDDDGDSHESSVRVHHVNDDFKGHQVLTVGGAITTLRGGEWVVETGRPGVYDVIGDKAWQDNGYGNGDSGQSENPPEPKSSFTPKSQGKQA